MLGLGSSARQSQGLIQGEDLGISGIGDVVPNAWVATYQLSLMAQVRQQRYLHGMFRGGFSAYS